MGADVACSAASRRAGREAAIPICTGNDAANGVGKETAIEEATAAKPENAGQVDDISSPPPGQADDAARPLHTRSYPVGAPTAWIYQPARSATQSGRANTRHWILRFEPREPSLPDHLMGWCGSGDTLQQVELRFPTKDAAIAYARRQGLEFRVVEPHPSTPPIRSYADNFRAPERR
jgi:hypothetical protein